MILNACRLQVSKCLLGLLVCACICQLCHGDADADADADPSKGKLPSELKWQVSSVDTGQSGLSHSHSCWRCSMLHKRIIVHAQWIQPFKYINCCLKFSTFPLVVASFFKLDEMWRASRCNEPCQVKWSLAFREQFSLALWAAKPSHCPKADSLCVIKPGLKLGLPARITFLRPLKVATRAELVFEKYVNGFGCKHRSVMVCKSCGASEMERVTISVTEEGFQVWCFDAGRIENLVGYSSDYSN